MFWIRVCRETKPVPDEKKVPIIHTEVPAKPTKKADPTKSPKVAKTQSKNELSEDDDYYNEADYNADEYYDDDEIATKSTKKAVTGKPTTSADVTKSTDKDIKLRPIEKTKVIIYFYWMSRYMNTRVFMTRWGEKRAKFWLRGKSS